MPDKLIPSPDYATWLGEVKSRIQSARILAARSVNHDLILLYWDIGRWVVEKQEKLGWGKTVIGRLSGDLRRAFPETNGFSPRNLRNMKLLFSACVNAAIWQRAVAKLPDAFLEQLIQETLSTVLWEHLKELDTAIGLFAECPRRTKKESNLRTTHRHPGHFVDLRLLRRLGSGPATEFQVIQP